jgi:Ni,Fe-hydrogenase III small subunit
MKNQSLKYSLLAIILFNSFFISNALQIVDKDYTTNKNCRWVKVSNDEAVPLDITLYKVLDSTASSSGHGITLTAQNPDKFLNAGETGTISNGDINCGYSGKVYRSAISTAGTVSGVVPYFIDMKAPSATTGGNTSSTNSISTNNVVQYNADYNRKTFTFGDLALLSPRNITGVAGGNTEFWVKAIDGKNNALISNVIWSFGDGVGANGATTSHRYVYPGSYIATIDAETNSVYGYERVNVNIISPNIEISEVENSADGSSITIKNNSDDEIDIGGFVLSMNVGFFKLSKHLIILPQSSIKLAGETIGFKRADNVRLLFENNTEVTRFNVNKSLSNFTNIINKSTSTKATSTKIQKFAYNKTIKNKVVVATNNKNIMAGPAKPNNTVEKGVDSTWHKWLYWLYD